MQRSVATWRELGALTHFPLPGPRRPLGALSRRASRRRRGRRASAALGTSRAPPSGLRGNWRSELLVAVTEPSPITAEPRHRPTNHRPSLSTALQTAEASSTQSPITARYYCTNQDARPKHRFPRPPPRRPSTIRGTSVPCTWCQCAGASEESHRVCAGSLLRKPTSAFRGISNDVLPSLNTTLPL